MNIRDTVLIAKRSFCNTATAIQDSATIRTLLLNIDLNTKSNVSSGRKCIVAIILLHKSIVLAHNRKADPYYYKLSKARRNNSLAEAIELYDKARLYLSLCKLHMSHRLRAHRKKQSFSRTQSCASHNKKFGIPTKS